jgi:hypothetical protein
MDKTLEDIRLLGDSREIAYVSQSERRLAPGEFVSAKYGGLGAGGIRLLTVTGTAAGVVLVAAAIVLAVVVWRRGKRT